MNVSRETGNELVVYLDAELLLSLAPVHSCCEDAPNSSTDFEDVKPFQETSSGAANRH